MADYGIQLGKVVFAGLLGVILTVDFVVALEAMYYWQLDRIEASDDAAPMPAKLNALLTEQEKRLTEYRVIDEKKGVVAIPISRAMDLVVDELSRSSGPDADSKGER